MVDQPLANLAQQGLLGVLLVIALIAIWWLFGKLQSANAALAAEKDRSSTAIQEEKDRRINDGAKTLETILKVQGTSTDLINKLSSIVEWAEKRADERPSVANPPARGPYRSRTDGE